MKKVFIFALLLIMQSIIVQPVMSQYAYRIVPVTALPATCDPRNGSVAALVTAGPVATIYACSTPNTWTQVGSLSTNLVINQGTLTASTPFLSQTATWNNAGVTFVDDFRNITDTASNANSLLMDLQVNGVDVFKVSKAGVTSIGAAPTNYALTPATPAAARAITLADPGGAATLAYTNPTAQQAISNTSISQATVTLPYSFFPTWHANGAVNASVADVNGQIWWSQIYIPTSITSTGACVQNGSGAGVDKWIFGLYNQTGTLVANTALAGVLQAGTSQLQCIAWTAPVALTGPQSYFIAVQGNGTQAAALTTYSTGGAPTNYGTGTQGGVFGTLAPITPAATFNAGVGPLMAVY